MDTVSFLQRKTQTTLSLKNMSWRQLYERYEEYYENNDLYNNILGNAMRNGVWVENMKSLRNPANRSVEFFVNKISTTKISASCDSDELRQAIEAIYKKGNLENQKRPAFRSFSIYGDLFYKAESPELGQVPYPLLIDPNNVTDFELDDRGNVVKIRIDTPVEENYNKKMYRVEMWTKEYLWVWYIENSPFVPDDELGDPDEYYTTAEMGFDYVPFTYASFRKGKHKRASNAFRHAILKIDESNRSVTQLHQNLFRYNKPKFMVTSNMVDSMGREIPAATLEESENEGTTQSKTDWKDEEILYLPGMNKLESLIPNINYADALAILNAMMTEIEQDLPELRYYSIKDSGISGKAITNLLAGALDRAQEARDNYSQALIRVTEMCVDMGIYSGAFSSTIGTYANGDFNHTVELGPMIVVEKSEMAATLKSLTDAGLPLAFSMKQLGFTQEQIQEALDEKQKEDQQSQQNFMNQFNAGNSNFGNNAK